VRVDINIKSNKCDFEQCVNHYEGICLNKQARKDCVDIAIAVLCLDKEVKNEGRLQEGV
jgi:hypothetical protein